MCLIHGWMHCSGFSSNGSKILVVTCSRISLHSSKFRFNHQFSLLHSPFSSYPINSLRNLALSNLTNTFILNLDADILPCGSWELLLEELPQYDLLSTVFVVPVFETTSKLALQCVSSPSFLASSPFRPFKATKSSRSYKLDTKAWLKQSSFAPSHYQDGYEPYLLFHSSLLGHLRSPLFDPSFTDFGYNKMDLVKYLAMDKQVSFLQVPPLVYLLHTHHEKTRFSERFSTDLLVRATNRLWRMRKVLKK